MNILTKEDIQALKRAESISFHVSTNENKYSYINTTIKLKDKIFNDVKTSSRNIQITSNVKDCGFNKAFNYISCAQYSLEWLTITSILKAGDSLHLSYYPNGNGNQYLKKNDLFGDFVRLLVRRGKKTLTFLLDSSVTPDNSSRMLSNY